MSELDPGMPSSAAGRSFPRIGDVLLERRLISLGDLARALAYQKERRPDRLLGQVLVELQLVTAEDLIGTLADASGIEFRRISPTMIDRTALEMLPRKFAEKHSVIPMSLSEDGLTIAMEDFTNIFLIEDIERLSGQCVSLVAATADNIREMLDTFAETSNFGFDQLMDEIHEDELTVVDKAQAEPADLEMAASDSPVVKLVSHLIHGAVHERASDVHIEPDDGCFVVRYRIDGDLYQKLEPPVGMLSAVVSRIKIMCGMDIAERRIPQDGGLTVIIEGRPIDLRVSTMPTKFGEKIVMRIIDKKAASLDLASLGFSESMHDDLSELISETNGVILVTGPTGSGKSTTLYGCLSKIVKPRINVSTVEDPIEYNLRGVNQFQTNDRAGFTFAQALRGLLRQDPDVIMIGEIRDEETARIAVQAALTGHLVLSTLHTNDAASAVTRLVNMGIEPYLVAASLRGVLAQRLVRKICERCRRPAVPGASAMAALHRLFGERLPVGAFYEGKGCRSCRDSGHSGRLGVYELLLPDDDLLEAVSRGATLQEIRRLATGERYTTLCMDGIEKVAAGLTTVESFLEVIGRRSDDRRAHEPQPPGQDGGASPTKRDAA